jgi:hypothetical protein
MASNIMKIFNEQMMDFINDIINVFPNNPELVTAKNSILLLKKSNPKLLIATWKEHIVNKYKEQIEKGDIDFFVNKNYSNDLVNVENSSKIMNCINGFRGPVKEMSIDNQQKTMKYIQNLTKLTELYYKNE